MPRSKLNIESYVNDLAKTVLADTQPSAEQESGSLESVLQGLTIELWSDGEGHRACESGVAAGRSDRGSGNCG